MKKISQPLMDSHLVLKMRQTPTQPKTLSLELPSELTLHVTPEQFETLAAANRDLRLERTSRVEIYRPGREVDVLENPSHLSGEDILPGFVLNLRRMWT